MPTSRILAFVFAALLGAGPTGTPQPPPPEPPDDAQEPFGVPLSCEPGAVSVDVSRTPRVAFERIARPDPPFHDAREFRFSQGPIRRVRLYLWASLPEGGVGRASEARLSVVAETASSPIDAEATVAWWRLTPTPSEPLRGIESAAESLLFDANTLRPCFDGERCRFADIDRAADDATALLVLGYSRDLGGANANNWEHARLVLDFRGETPRVAVAVDCAYNEGGGACTAFDSGQMPRSDLTCPWDGAVGDFACSETSDSLGHRDFQLMSGRAGAGRDGEVARIEEAARRLAAGPPGGVEIVTGLGRVRHVQDVPLGTARVIVLFAGDRFLVVERTAGGIGAIRDVRPQRLAPDPDVPEADTVGDAAGWTSPSDPVVRSAEIYRDSRLVVLRVVQATQYAGSAAAPRPHSMYWLAIDASRTELAGAALTVVAPGVYGGCGQDVVPTVVTAVGRTGRGFDVPITVQPPTSMNLATELTWQSEDDEGGVCRRPGRVRWRNGGFDVRLDDRACAAAEPPRFVVLGLDGTIRLAGQFPEPWL